MGRQGVKPILTALEAEHAKREPDLARIAALRLDLARARKSTGSARSTALALKRAGQE